MKGIVLIFILVPLSVFAHVRIFTYSYEANLLPSGLTEYETWITLKNGKESGLYSQYDIRFEVEHAFTPNLSIDFYLDFSKVFYAYPDGSVVNTSSFKGIAWAWIYRLKYVGFYTEFYFYGNSFKPEFKLLLSKSFGNIHLVTNLTNETKFEVVSVNEIETESELSLTGGISYFFPLGDRDLSTGVEWKTHHAWPDKYFPSGKPKYTALFLGPSIHYSTEKIWATLTVMPQITKVLDEHERFEVRLIIGLPL